MNGTFVAIFTFGSILPQNMSILYMSNAVFLPKYLAAMGTLLVYTGLIYNFAHTCFCNERSK